MTPREELLALMSERSISVDTLLTSHVYGAPHPTNGWQLFAKEFLAGDCGLESATRGDIGRLAGVCRTTRQFWLNMLPAGHVVPRERRGGYALTELAIQDQQQRVRKRTPLPGVLAFKPIVAAETFSAEPQNALSVIPRLGPQKTRRTKLSDAERVERRREVQKRHYFRKKAIAESAAKHQKAIDPATGCVNWWQS